MATPTIARVETGSVQPLEMAPLGKNAAPRIADRRAVHASETALLLRETAKDAYFLCGQYEAHAMRRDDAAILFQTLFMRIAGRLSARSPQLRDTLNAIVDALKRNDAPTLRTIAAAHQSDPLDGTAIAVRDIARATERFVNATPVDLQPVLETMAIAANFAPLLGQVISGVELARAIQHLRDSRDGAALEVGLAGTAFLPALGFLKVGRSLAGREILKEAAKITEPAARSGLRQLTRVLTPKTHALVASEVRVINVARVELIARLERHCREVPESTQQLLRRCQRSLRDHLEAADVVGWIRDSVDLPVRKSGSGIAFQHKTEVRAVLDSIKNTVEKMEKMDATDALIEETKRGLMELRSRLRALEKIK